MSTNQKIIIPLLVGVILLLSFILLLTSQSLLSNKHVSTTHNQSLPQLIKRANITWFENIPNSHQALYSDGFDLIYLDLTTGQEQLIFSRPHEKLDTIRLLPLTWSANEKYFLILQQQSKFSDYLLYNSKTNSIQSLFELTEENFNTVTWDHHNDELLYGARNDVITQINLHNLTKKIILAKIIHDFLGVEPISYFTYDENNRSYFGTKMNSEVSAKPPIPFFQKSLYTIIDSNDDFIFVRDSKKRKVLIVDKKIFGATMNEYPDLMHKVNGTNVIVDENSALVFDNHEILFVDLKTFSKILLERSSTSIHSVTKREDQIFYVSANTIFQIEKRGETYERKKIAEMNEIKKISVDKHGEVITILGSVGSQEGLFEIGIREP